MENHDEKTALQKHVAFFDRNKDGIMYPSETYQGLVFYLLLHTVFIYLSSIIIFSIKLMRRRDIENFPGFRAIGCGILLSSAASVFINLGLSSKTRPNKSLSLHFPIEVKNINLGKHTSDSGVYDKEGRFLPNKFEEIFIKHARTHPNALTSDELKEFMKSNREPKDYGGWIAGFTEWKILYFLCKDEKGLLHKDTIRAAFDGSLFEKLEKEHTSKKKK